MSDTTKRIERALKDCGPTFRPSRLMSERIRTERNEYTIGSFAANRRQALDLVLNYSGAEVDLTPILKLLIGIEDKTVREEILKEVEGLSRINKNLRESLDEARKSMNTIESEYSQIVIEYLEANKAPEESGAESS